MGVSYREQNNLAAAARRGIEEQRPVGGKSKAERPFIVEMRWNGNAEGVWIGPHFREWTKHGAYRSEEDAMKVIELCTRKGGRVFEYRLRPPVEQN